MEIVPIGPDDTTALLAWHALLADVAAADTPDEPPPTRREILAALAVPWPGEPALAWLAREAGRVRGAAVLALPDRDNPTTAVVDITVHPADRRRGTGRALLTHAAAVARADGRVRLRAESLDPLDATGPGTAFALAVGARLALGDVRRRLTVHGPPAPVPVVPGYRYVTWSDGTPPEREEEMARLTGRMSLDSPQGDLEWEPEVVDPARVRERDALCRSRGYRMVVTVAEAPDASLAAFTELVVGEGSPHWAWQWNTLVDPPHRGHGLGLAVKTANLAAVRVRFPGLRTVQTVNAADNAPMVAVNDTMGFRPVDRLQEWQLGIV
ncbi:MAG: GNAT family N-acetyltransferase [Pseudonocardiales bacterium]|nr:GNAT family N-acetyltransferase [Pseudonocardiales bacterium]